MVFELELVRYAATVSTFSFLWENMSGNVVLMGVGLAARPTTISLHNFRFHGVFRLLRH